MRGTQHHFVLVHGAGHGAWCWVKIVPVLQKAGHRVTAIDLVSAGGNSVTAADDVTSLQQYNRPLEDFFASFPDDERVILVGHSLGGLSLTRVSELFSKNISVAVYFSAIMPGPSPKVYELTAAEPDFFTPVERKQNFKVEGGPPTSLEFTPSMLKEYFYNKCSLQDLAFAVDHIKGFPAPAALFAPFHPTEEKYGTVPKMIGVNPPTEVHEVDGDHSLFFSAVESVEKILNYAAAKYDS